MFIIETYSVAVLFCIVTMFCWGSWAERQNIGNSKACLPGDAPFDWAGNLDMIQVWKSRRTVSSFSRL